MSHTKEPWGISRLYHRSERKTIIPKAHENRPFGGSIDPKVSLEKYAWIIARCGSGVGVAGYAEENAARIVACVNACANLPEPEKNIRELVEQFKGFHDRTWDAPIQGQARHKAGERPEECGGCYAFAPFKNNLCGVCGMSGATQNGVCEPCAIEQRAREE